MKGYEKIGMTKEEILKERAVFAKFHSLDFMIDDNIDLQEEELLDAVIFREATKTKEQKIEDYCQLNGNLELKCESVNGFM